MKKQIDKKEYIKIKSGYDKYWVHKYWYEKLKIENKDCLPKDVWNTVLSDTPYNRIELAKRLFWELHITILYNEIIFKIYRWEYSDSFRICTLKNYDYSNEKIWIIINAYNEYIEWWFLKESENYIELQNNKLYNILFNISK